MSTKPMTLRQFFERLPRDGWERCNRGIWRTVKDGKEVKCWDCPITAALEPEAGRGAMKAVAQRHQFDMRLAWAITHAADGAGRLTPTERRIRRLLLKHCNLTETTT